jgi:hypothetical protein
MDFPSLQHVPGLQVHVSRACRPASFRLQGFLHPLDGLLPANPGRFCFAPAALLGFRPSKRSPTAGSSRRFRDDSHPRTVCPAVAPDTRPSRPDRPRFLGFAPGGSSWRPHASYTPQSLVAPLGFLPSRVHSSERLGNGIPAGLLSRAWLCGHRVFEACTSEFLGLRRASSSRHAETQPFGKGNPLRVSAPVRPTCSSAARSGL